MVLHANNYSITRPDDNRTLWVCRVHQRTLPGSKEPYGSVGYIKEPYAVKRTPCFAKEPLGFFEPGHRTLISKSVSSSFGGL